MRSSSGRRHVEDAPLQTGTPDHHDNGLRECGPVTVVWGGTYAKRRNMPVNVSAGPVSRPPGKPPSPLARHFSVRPATSSSMNESSDLRSVAISMREAIRNSCG